jgi:hypothetical protein
LRVASSAAIDPVSVATSRNGMNAVTSANR